ncbi:hypothetical protein J2W30_006244 [Variovorax boronicumulans]|uniref:hypothetical protein n=1 Tax=Variovorax boronicumulans TaxID=436515 RepID=UPI00278B156F|nr:hypothetical protein [Variovorax boronicumulans]MDQ0038457.1 hypothetical protein [Variovorax boronicumulans]
MALPAAPDVAGRFTVAATALCSLPPSLRQQGGNALGLTTQVAAISVSTSGCRRTAQAPTNAATVGRGLARPARSNVAFWLYSGSSPGGGDFTIPQGSESAREQEINAAATLWDMYMEGIDLPAIRWAAH